MSAKKSKKKLAFGIPPHINAAPHRALMKELSRMSAEEIFQTAVQAGIYTKSGKLTKHYRPDSSHGSRTGSSSGPARVSRSASARTSRSRSSAR